MMTAGRVWRMWQTEVTWTPELWSDHVRWQQLQRLRLPGHRLGLTMLQVAAACFGWWSHPCAPGWWAEVALAWQQLQQAEQFWSPWTAPTTRGAVNLLPWAADLTGATTYSQIEQGQEQQPAGWVRVVPGWPCALRGAGRLHVMPRCDEGLM